jgi:hypothetical protein
MPAFQVPPPTPTPQPRVQAPTPTPTPPPVPPKDSPFDARRTKASVLHDFGEDPVHAAREWEEQSTTGTVLEVDITEVNDDSEEGIVYYLDPKVIATSSRRTLDPV